MTRLIDADALRDALQYEIDKATPPFDDTVGAVRCGIRLARNIAEDQPTVEAVPIEWMLKWDDAPLTDESMKIGSTVKTKEIGRTVNWNTVKWMILEWRKSNG